MRVTLFKFSLAGESRALSRTDWALIGLILLGFSFFLIGANAYNDYVGWFGVFLFAGSLLALIILYVRGALEKKVLQKA
jgi:hypothetical protein